VSCADSGILAVGEAYSGMKVTLYDLETFEKIKEISLPEGDSYVSYIQSLALDGNMLIFTAQMTGAEPPIVFYNIETDKYLSVPFSHNVHLALDRATHTVWALSTAGSPISCASFNSQTGEKLSDCWNLEGFYQNAADNFNYDGLNPTGSFFGSAFSMATNSDFNPFIKHRIDLPKGLSDVDESSLIDNIEQDDLVVNVISGGTNGIEAAVVQDKDTYQVSTVVRNEKGIVRLNLYAEQVIPCKDRILLWVRTSHYVVVIHPEAF